MQGICKAIQKALHSSSNIHGINRRYKDDTIGIEHLPFQSLPVVLERASVLSVREAQPASLAEFEMAVSKE
jgi:hypothetical protein